MLAEDLPAGDLELLLKEKAIRLKPDDDLLKKLIRQEKENAHLKSLSLTDGLTNLYNRRFFSRQLKIEITRTKRTGQPFCLMIIDLDNFKSVNDTLGHHKGDEFLVNISKKFCQKIRPTDFACRYGGDEFAVIMPATSLLDGISIAQRWHDMIEEVATQMKLDVSSSIGINEFNTVNSFNDKEFFAVVDKELYRAKNSGKSRISYPGYPQKESLVSDEVSCEEKEALFKAFKPLTNKKRGVN